MRLTLIVLELIGLAVALGALAIAAVLVMDLY